MDEIIIVCFLILMYVTMLIVIHFVDDINGKCNEIIRLLKKEE